MLEPCRVAAILLLTLASCAKATPRPSNTAPSAPAAHSTITPDPAVERPTGMTQGPPRFVGDKTALMLEVEQAVREKEAREAEVARERQATVAAVWAKYDGLPASERTREALSSTFQEAERQTYDLAPQHEREIRKVNRIALRRRFPLPDGARVDGDEAEILVFALPAEPCAKMVEQALARRDWVEALSKIGFKQLQCPGNAPPRASAAAGKAARVTWEVSETPRDLERAGP